MAKFNRSWLVPFPSRQKELSRHVSDPLHVQMEKSICKRQHQRHRKYRREWTEMGRQRKGKSLMERSLEKATEHIRTINEDAEQRRKCPSFEKQLRNSIDEETFVCPGAIRRDVEGLKGKGGRMLSLFDAVRIVE